MPESGVDLRCPEIVPILSGWDRDDRGGFTGWRSRASYVMGRKDTERQSRVDPVVSPVAPLDRSADAIPALEVIGLDRPPELTPQAARVLLRILRTAAGAAHGERGDLAVRESDQSPGDEEATA